MNMVAGKFFGQSDYNQGVFMIKRYSAAWNPIFKDKRGETLRINPAHDLKMGYFSFLNGDKKILLIKDKDASPQLAYPFSDSPHFLFENLPELQQLELFESNSDFHGTGLTGSFNSTDKIVLKKIF